MSLEVPTTERLVLRRYLLGQLSLAEQDQVEEQFEDPNYFAKYQVVERLLVQEYAAGTMAPTESDLFARNYLVTRKRRDQVAIIRALLEVHSNPPSSQHARSKHFEKWIPVFAAAASVIVGAIGWSHWRQTHPIQKAAVRPIDSPVGGVDVAPKLSPSRPGSEALPAPLQRTPPASAGKGEVTALLAPSAPGPPAPVSALTPESAATPAKPAHEKELVPEYALTQVTADQTGIVTPGAILVLKKGNIAMAPVSGTNLDQNIYKEGRVSQAAIAPASVRAVRTFVPGEKMWVTKIEREDDGLVLELLTDEYAGVRYRAALKFYFNPKGRRPSVKEMDKLVGEVFKVQPANAGGGNPRAAALDSHALAAPSSAPPPLAASPAQGALEITLGQSIDQVTALLGQPMSVVDLGAKKIYRYKDMSVVFKDGKVIDIQ
jgi:hypothetical protein